jgi:hypothetical protein
VAGFVGRFVAPGKDQMGWLATILLGLAGVAVGSVILTELLVSDDDVFHVALPERDRTVTAIADYVSGQSVWGT